MTGLRAWPTSPVGTYVPRSAPLARSRVWMPLPAVTTTVLEPVAAAIVVEERNEVGGAVRLLLTQEPRLIGVRRGAAAPVIGVDQATAPVVALRPKVAP